MNQKGLSLVEVLISLVILLMVFAGLIQASLVSINTNMHNAVRDGAVSLASEFMTRARATPIDTLTGGNQCGVAGYYYLNKLNYPTLIRQVNNIALKYAITTKACFTDSTMNSATVTVFVTYVYPGDAATAVQSTTINSILVRQ